MVFRYLDFVGFGHCEIVFFLVVVVVVVVTAIVDSIPICPYFSSSTLWISLLVFGRRWFSAGLT